MGSRGEVGVAGQGVRADTGAGGRGRGRGAPYRDVLLQSALRKDSVELGPQGPLRKDGEHHTFQDQGVHALKDDDKGQQSRTKQRGCAERLLPAPGTAGAPSAAGKLHDEGCSTKRARPSAPEPGRLLLGGAVPPARLRWEALTASSPAG